jgi:BASS family bile acid:Na+ symporter
MIQNLDQLKIHFDTNALWLVNITLAIIMFGVALDITINDFKNLFKQPKAVFIGVFSQFFLVPAITLLLVYAIKPQASLALGMMMVAACPGGNVSNFMTKLAKGNTALSVSLTAFATAMALFMTPINLAIWASLYTPTADILKTINLDPFEVTKIVTLILGIPLIVGMLIRHYKANFATKLSKIIKPISILILIAFITVAFYENLDIFQSHIHHVFYLVFILNTLLYVVGFYTAKFSGLSYENQKTLSIETGIQNSGLGLMLVFLFFEGLGGMALLVAFWGIWDIFSGLVLAYFWNRKQNSYDLINDK